MTEVTKVTEVRVDLKRYAEQLELQRNAALNEAAQWRAVAEQTMAELRELQGDQGDGNQ